MKLFIPLLSVVISSSQPLAQTEELLSHKDLSAIKAVVDKLPPKVCSWSHTMDNEGKIILVLKDSGENPIGLCFETELRRFECDFFK